jgi:response regulator RpfG family c-di-GMP phosphodiesterase
MGENMNYTDSSELERALNRAFVSLGISEKQKNSIETYLNLVRKNDEESWQHSVRVGLKGKEVAEFTHIVEPKGLFYPGLLHDVGKSKSDPNSLKKKMGFGPKDKEELDKHVLDGYLLLKGIHDFSAMVLLYHHYFSGDAYPEIVPDPLAKFSKGSKASIIYYARLLSVIDFYDSITYRENDKFSPGNPRLPSRDEAKSILIKSIPDQKYFINELYKAGIFI